jgi:hypothetical protein
MNKHGGSAMDGERVTITYELYLDTKLCNRRFTDDEKQMLRPIAETLSMLDGNAFLTMPMAGGREWYEQYLPEAYALFQENGGITGWAGECCWIRETNHENPSVAAAYDSWRTLKALSRGATDAEDNSRPF